MPLRKAVPVRVRPRGVADTTDGGNSPPGSMHSLSNLIFDPDTPFTLQCRPACTKTTAFASFTTPGVVSVAYQVGSVVYGMIASGRNAGHDEPFAFNMVTGAFVTVGGTINAATTPTTPATTGDWTPPAMDLMGTKLIVVHPGFPGGLGVYFGWFDISNPAAPTWNAGNMTGTPLTQVPTVVGVMNNRAYINQGNALWFTDALALNFTSATQYVTIGTSEPIVALTSFSLTTTTQGNLQALLAIKTAGMTQITGDAATSNLSVNALNSSVGTRSPRSVKATPQGVYLVANDGVRRVTPDGLVTDPNPDIQVPFVNALYPSRIAAGYNMGTYRVCLQNHAVSGDPYEDYWYDLAHDAWTGPHTFRYDEIVPYSDRFILFNTAKTPGLWESRVMQIAGVGFVEDGTQLSWVYQTPPLADLQNLQANSTVSSTINLAYASGSPTLYFTLSDELGGVLTNGQFTTTLASTIWGAFTWGAALWFGVTYGLKPYLIPWTNPAVFTKVVFKATSVSTLGLKIGNFQLIYQPLGYTPP